MQFLHRDTLASRQLCRGNVVGPPSGHLYGIPNVQPAALQADPDELLLRRMVKAADKLSALIKCIEEERSGNQEFRTAKESTEKALAAMAAELPEVQDFLTDFLPSYGKTLDELT